MTNRKDAKIYDSRVIERYLRSGAITQAQHDTYMKSLADETTNAQWVQLDLHDAELGETAGQENASTGDEEVS
jgi:hypothetical protein